MRVKLQLMALPALAEAMGGKKAEVEFPGTTVADLIDHLVKQYGRAACEALLDQHGRLDPIIQILVNEKEWVVHDELDVPLEEGDHVILMLLVVGG
jgi:molybdopterin converting factor small subunit